MLSLIATPIGNLQDMTLRALETLKRADYILCEDTRHSLKLLNFFGIQKPLYSLHSYNENEKIEKIVSDLKSGKNIALMSDAGTPGICDPSAFLVRACHQAGIKVVAAVGPSAVISALSLYGLIRPSFQFLGFAPKESKDLEDFLKKAVQFDGTSIFFETPHHIKRTFLKLKEMSFSKEISVAFELSKIHERIESRLVEDWLLTIEEKEIKGEMVFLLEGEKKSEEVLKEEEVIKTLKDSLDLPFSEIIKLASKLLKTPKNALYKKWL